MKVKAKADLGNLVVAGKIYDAFEVHPLVQGQPGPIEIMVKIHPFAGIEFVTFDSKVFDKV